MSNKSNKKIIESMGDYGGVVVNDTNEHTGNFCAISALTSCTITAVGNVSGLTAIDVSAGQVVPGLFTSVTLGAGTAILYYQG